MLEGKELLSLYTKRYLGFMLNEISIKENDTPVYPCNSKTWSKAMTMYIKSNGTVELQLWYNKPLVETKKHWFFFKKTTRSLTSAMVRKTVDQIEIETMCCEVEQIV